MGRFSVSVLCVLLGPPAARVFAASAESAPITQGQHAPGKISTTHFDVEFSVPPPVGRGYASLCEKAYSRFSQIFEVKTNEKVWNGKCQVYLFANREQFVRFAAEVDKTPIGAVSGGYTRPTKEDPHIVLFIRGSDHVKLQQTIIHEMCHVFLQLFRKEAFVPLWLNEGFAQYFEFSHVPGESREKLSRRLVKAMVSQNRSAPLSVFFVSYFPPMDLASYAQSWSLVDFISTNPDLCHKTGRFILKLKELSPGQQAEVSVDGKELKAVTPPQNLLQVQEAALKEVFGVSISQFEAMWKRYVMATY